MANLFDTDYFAERKKKAQAAKAETATNKSDNAGNIMKEPEPTKEVAQTPAEAETQTTVSNEQSEVKGHTTETNEQTSVKTVAQVNRKMSPEKRIVESVKSQSNTKLNYNIDKSKTSDVKGVNSRFLQILKQKLSKYGVTSNSEALNVFIASVLGDYAGLSAETKDAAKRFREEDSVNSGKLIDAKLKRIEDNIGALKGIVDFNYYMVNALAMYAVNAEGFNKFQKEGVIDMTEPSLTDFVNRVSDTFIAMQNTNKYSDGRPIR